MKANPRLYELPPSKWAARPLFAGAVQRPPRAVAGARSIGSSTSSSPGRPDGVTLAELAEGPYFVLAVLLDAHSLGTLDAACRLLLGLNNSHAGPWRALGADMFHGLELEQDGIFERLPLALRTVSKVEESMPISIGRVDSDGSVQMLGCSSLLSVVPKLQRWRTQMR